MNRSDPDETNSNERDREGTDETPDSERTDDASDRERRSEDAGIEAAYADSLDPADANVDDLDLDAIDAAGADALVCVCDAGGVLDLLASRHAIAVVCVVGALEPVRYGDIETVLEDASSSTLSTRLSDLADAGILAREQYDEIPPRVEYELSEDGHALYEALQPLVDWARERDGVELA